MSEDVLAPMAGKIIKINVEVGSEIEEDEEIIIIEAMKMETPIFAPCDGKITKIMKKEGDEIEEDDPLATIE